MDDNLGQPTFLTRDPMVDDNNEESSEEDAGPDWTKLLPTKLSSLPKRGDKEFEPAADGPTDLQVHFLNRARDAMFHTLSTERGISNKSVSYAVWYPDLARAHVTQARGVLFNGMGHSVARETDGKVHKRMELLPEETLYLIERGSLFCWKHEATTRISIDIAEDDMQGSPMSVQQAFAEMIGKESLTLDRYHAFAYLKRLGFNVLRANPPSSSYPIPPPVTVRRSEPLVARLGNYILTLVSRLWQRIFHRVNWWKPLKVGTWLGCARNYASVYHSLRLIPSGHNHPLHLSTTKPNLDESLTPYEIFYNIYKPNTPFRKSAPPVPDFSLVVVNARMTPLPTIYELTRLWSFLPETGPPPPRQRNNNRLLQNPSTPASRPPPPPATATRLFGWFSESHGQERLKAQPRKPHPFAVLRAGKKTVIIGVVDSGTVGFFRFGMGAFEEIPMI